MERLRVEALTRGHCLSDAAGCDAAVLPQPDSQGFSEKLAQCAGRGRCAIVGRLTENACTALQNAGWRVIFAQQNEDYALKNALLTAEGAVYCAMDKSKRALRGSVCCVVGYGRIGRELARLLAALGAHIRVAARREAARREAQSAVGAAAFDIPLPESALQGCDMVFNTVPAAVLGDRELLRLPPDALIIELASPPYGVNLEAARRLGLAAYIESGLPARYAPVSAARLLMDLAENAASGAAAAKAVTADG